MSFKSYLSISMIVICQTSIQAWAQNSPNGRAKSCSVAMQPSILKNSDQVLNDLVELTRQKAILPSGSALEKLVTQELETKWRELTRELDSEQIANLKVKLAKRLRRAQVEQTAKKEPAEKPRSNTNGFIRPAMEDVKIESPLQLQDAVVVAKYGWIQPNAKKTFSGDGLTRMVIEPKYSNGTWSEQKVSLDGPQISEAIASGRLNGKGNKHKLNVTTLKSPVDYYGPVLSGRELAIVTNDAKGTNLLIIDTTTAQVKFDANVSPQLIGSVKIEEIKGKPGHLLVYGSAGNDYERSRYAVVDTLKQLVVFNGEFNSWGGEVRVDPYAVLDPRGFEILSFKKEKFVRFRSDGEPYLESGVALPKMEYIGHSKNLGEAYFLQEGILMAISTETGDLIRTQSLGLEVAYHAMDPAGGDFIHLYERQKERLITLFAKDFKQAKAMQLQMDTNLKISSESKLFASYDNMRETLSYGTLDIKQSNSINTKSQILNPKPSITYDQKNLLVEDMSGTAIVLKITK